MSNIHEVPSDITFDKFPVIDRKPYSEHLTNFLNSKAKDGYVLNLNAEWGAGKTTFLQCWYNELREKHPVVYFDAWKSDFTHDAMLAITESFHSQLMSPQTDNKELLRDLKTKGTHLLKVALPSLLVGYLKHKTGTEDVSLLGDITTELNIDIEQDELGDALKETMKAMINQKKKVDGIHVFRKALEELAESYLDVFKDKSAPIYVLVDELDRCRPTYAIEVIECIKHFFNTKNFVFVLATDTDQLQHSIRAVYGEGFDSASYLSRFFDRTAVLPQPTIREHIKIRLTEIVGYFPQDDLLFDLLIAQLFEWHGIRSLREINKIFGDIEVAAATQHNFKILALIILSIQKHRYPNHYKNYNDRGVIPYSPQSQQSPDYIKNTIFTPTFPITKFTQANIIVILYDICRSISFTTYDENLYLKSLHTKPEGTAAVSQVCRNLSNYYGTKKNRITSR